MIRVVRKNSRQKCTGSLNIQIPSNAVPTAPIPVHTAYAVPIGRVWVALYRRAILMAREARKPISHQVAVVPVENFALPRQNAKPTSNNPAIIRISQFIRRYDW